MEDTMEIEGTYLSRDGKTRLYVLATSRYLVLWTAENTKTRQAVGPALQKAKRTSFLHLIKMGALVQQDGTVYDNPTSGNRGPIRAFRDHLNHRSEKARKPDHFGVHPYLDIVSFNFLAGSAENTEAFSLLCNHGFST